MPRLDAIGTIEYIALTILIYIVNHPVICLLILWLTVSFRYLADPERKPRP